MAKFFKNIGSSISKLADIINGSETENQASPQTGQSVKEAAHAASEKKVQQAPKRDDGDTQPLEEKPEEKPKKESQQPKQAVPAEPEETETDIFNNAIDKRDLAVRYLVDEFRQATGTSHSGLASLYIYVIVESENFDLTHYAWSDNTMKEQLRLSLDNAMLEAVGRKKLEIQYVTKENLPASAREVVPDILYYAFISAPVAPRQSKARITVVEGTGSLAAKEYTLDSTVKSTYHIGRGPMSRKPGAMRPNDIVVRDTDPDNEIQQRNNHVSSAHADIVASNGHFYLKALRWGCRPMGGASTKLIYDGDEHEVRDINMKYPLKDGYMIELGKEVVLVFNELT